MGLLVLLVATAWVGFAAFSVARRACDDDAPIQLVVTTGVLLHAVVLAPMWLLGLFGVLTATTTALGTGGLALALVLAVAMRDGGRAAFFEETRRAGRALRRLPEGLWRAARRAGFPLWLGVLVALGLWTWLAFGVCFSPPRGNADALFYHEPMVGFMIQNRGLEPVPLPPLLERINGFPRFSQMTQLWFALFTGRTFVEWPNLLAHPLAVASLYGLARRVGAQKSSAIAWAFCFPLVPGVLRLTDGIMVDVHAAALVAAAAYCVLAVRLTARSALVAGTAIALLVGTKYHYLVIAFVLTLLLLGRLWSKRREWSLPVVALTSLGASAIVLLSLSAVVVRNWIEFSNPIFPAGLRVDALGIDLRAPAEMKNAWTSGKGLGPLGVIDKWLASPFSVKPWNNPSARVEDYGLATVFLSLPLSLVALLGAGARVLRRRRQRRPLPPALWALIGVLLVLVAAFATFPSIVRGRYYLGMIGLTFVATSSLFAAPARREAGRQLAFAAQVMMLISVVYAARQDWILNPADVWARLQVPASERDFTKRRLLTVTREVGLARLEEMTAGKKVGFDEAHSLGQLWNDDYSNQVVWLGKHRTLERADELDVDWLFLYRRTLESMSRDPRAKQWEYIGEVLTGSSWESPGRVYRRAKPIEAAPAPRSPSSPTR